MSDVATADADRKLEILVLYDRDILRINTVREHLESFRFYSRHNVTYSSSSVADRIDPDSALDFGVFDVVMVHYSVRVCFDYVRSERLVEALRSFGGYRLLFLQDDYECTEGARKWIEDAGIDHVFTVVPESEIARVYDPARFPRVRFTSTLTGYVPLRFESGEMPFVPHAERPHQIVYRGRSLPLHYGELGREKLEIGVRMREVCEERGIPCDIEWEEDKRVYGGAWYALLSSGVATLGTESGSNVFDFDGSIRRNVEEALEAHPGLTYEEARERFFEEGNAGVRMNQISPKFFEFIAARTLLILFEGEYSGILEPDVHYLPLRKDFGNVDEVFEKLRSPDLVATITERAYRDVVASGKYSFRAFVAQVDAELDPVPRSAGVLEFEGRFDWHLDRVQRWVLGDARQEAKIMSDRVAALRGKLENFRGMIRRRDEKIAKLSQSAEKPNPRSWNPFKRRPR